MAAYSSIVSFFQEGGLFMYPIAFIMVLGLSIALERWIFLTAASVSNRSAIRRILPWMEKKDLNSILKFTRSSKAPLSSVISTSVKGMPSANNRQELEYAFEEGLLATTPRLEKRTPYLATLANVATLLGLLGTIIGLIAAFTAVAHADPSEKASLLSQSISVAMNTTAFGLMAAIPLLLIHAYLQSKTNEILDTVDAAGVKFLNLLANSKK